MSNIIDKIQVSGVTYDLPSGGSGSTTVELTQAEYDALVSGGTVDPNTYYIISDASPADMSNYWTSAQTNSAITQAVSGKVDTSAITTSVTSGSTDSEIPTAKAVYDAIPTGGTGGSYSAGTGIDITNNVITCTKSETKGLTLDNVSSPKNYIEYRLQSVNWGTTYATAKLYLGSNLVYNNTNTLSVSGLTQESAFTAHSGDTTLHTTQAEKDSWNGKIDSSAITSSITSVSTDSQVPSAKAVYDAISQGGGGGSITIDPTLDSGSTNPVANSAITTALDAKQDTLVSGTNIKTINNQSILGSGNIDIQGSVTVDQTIISGSTNPVAGGAVYDALGDIETLLASI